MAIEERLSQLEDTVTATREAIDHDLQLAATIGGAVLITGPLAQAQAVAIEIHRRHSVEPRPFEVVDCDHPDVLASLDEADGGTVFLRHVDRLSPSTQTRLLDQLARTHRRVIAWSQECPNQALDPRLFYRLNTVHIWLGPARSWLAMPES